MAYGLSFADDFFYGESEEEDRKKTSEPKNVRQALFNMPDDEWNEMCKEVFHTHPDFIGIEEVMDQIMEVDTCSDLCSPVCVWIDEDGYYFVEVYD